MYKKICIDLCCGLGGFSQAFTDAGWDVIKVDIKREFRPTIIADVRKLPVKDNLQPYIVVASPPCERFSIANRRFPKKGIRTALEIVGSCLESIVDLNTKYWVIENPKGRLRWFLGTPNQSLHLSNYGSRIKKPTDLWGNVQLPMVSKIMPYEKSWSDKGTKYNVRKPSERAKLPYGLSKAILEALPNEHF